MNTEQKYEYRTLVISPPFMRGFMDKYYLSGWEPMFSTAVVNDYYGSRLLFTVRRPVVEEQQTDGTDS